MTRILDFLDEEIGRQSFPGACALVGSADSIHEIAHAGSAAREPRIAPVTAETLFDLASLTKVLCTAALGQRLREVDIASPPGRFFPGWKRTRYEGITVEMLWTHTSGLPAWFPLYSRGEGVAAYRQTLSEIEPEARPGERVVYSDLNFLLLGEILETAVAAPLDRAFAEMTAMPAESAARFLPLPGTATAATEKDDATERSMTEARGLSYAHFRSGVVWGEVHDGNAFRRGGVAGNAGLFGTARDVWSLARRWLDPDRAEWCVDRTPALSEARGLAWQGSRGAGSSIGRMSPRAFGHTGFTGTSVWLDPDADLITVLLTNRVHPTVRDAHFNEVRRRFHEIVYDEFSAPRG
ncbi:MAG TPA: serine hydrolase domain-containing protein [Thermoanaerobaculia bacterium]